jgi:hypothetical protein
MTKVWDPTYYQEEEAAHQQQAKYFYSRGGHHWTTGLNQGFLEGDVRGRIKPSEEGIRQKILDNYGVTKDSPGRTATEREGLRPPP